MTSNRRVVLITGASSGIGYATALAFAAQGDDVIGTARRAERLHQLAQAIEALPGDFLPVASDVRQAESLQSAVEQGVKHFGKIDVLVANAGVGLRGDLVDASWDDISTLLQTNIDGVLHSVRSVVPVMRTNGGGHIIMLSSVAYNLVSPYAALYAASKAFVSSLSHSLRLELKADNILVTDMLVGRVQTEFSDNRLGKAGRGGNFPPAMPVEDVASAIVNSIGKNRKALAIRWIDRMVLLANVILPDTIGKQALKQYRE